MIEKLKHKYALSSKGAKDKVRAFIAEHFLILF